MTEAEFSAAMSKIISQKVADLLELSEPPELELSYAEVIEWLDRMVGLTRPPLVFPETEPMPDSILWRNRFGLEKWKAYTSSITWPVI